VRRGPAREKAPRFHPTLTVRAPPSFRGRPAPLFVTPCPRCAAFRCSPARWGGWRRWRRPWCGVWRKGVGLSRSSGNVGMKSERARASSLHSFLLHRAFPAPSCVRDSAPHTERAAIPLRSTPRESRARALPRTTPERCLSRRSDKRSRSRSSSRRPPPPPPPSSPRISRSERCRARWRGERVQQEARVAASACGGQDHLFSTLPPFKTLNLALNLFPSISRNAPTPASAPPSAASRAPPTP